MVAYIPSTAKLMNGFYAPSNKLNIAHLSFITLNPAYRSGLDSYFVTSTSTTVTGTPGFNNFTNFLFSFVFLIADRSVTAFRLSGLISSIVGLPTLAFLGTIFYTFTISNSIRGRSLSRNFSATIFTHLLSFLIALTLCRQSKTTFRLLSRSERCEG